MQLVKNTISNTPLILRVVCLYVLVTTPILSLRAIAQPVVSASSVKIPITKTIAKKVSTKPAIIGYPERIIIKRLGINLPIVEGVYNSQNDTWTLNDYAVHFATITTQPNDQQGHTFLYGHNTIEVLEPVKNIIPGDELQIVTKNKHVFTYQYQNDSSVTPDNTAVLNYTSKKPKLTLMTCEGLFSQTRRLLYFDFKGVS